VTLRFRLLPTVLDFFSRLLFAVSKAFLNFDGVGNEMKNGIMSIPSCVHSFLSPMLGCFFSDI
jgi:hypothetical protein